MPIRPPSDPYSDLQKYIEYVNEFPSAKGLRLGGFYSFNYLIDRKPYTVKRYYDLMPLMFLFDTTKAKQGLIFGLNFHHLPYEARIFWLEKAKNFADYNFDRNNFLKMFSSYDVVYNLYKKAANAAIRQYDVKKMFSIKRIPNTEMETVCAFYAKTYYGITIRNVENRFMLTSQV